MHKLLARFVIAGAILAPSVCLAQIGAGPTTLGSASKRTTHGGGAKPEAAPPPVLPGTKSAPEAAAPTQSVADMSPTEALFDAINRGDLPASREAFNRGANLDAHNLLGLTPLELSVDLGRNDISFLLLSLRGEETTSGPGGGRRDNSRRDSAAATPDRSRVAAPPPRGADTTAQSAPVAAPRLYSGNGGAPIPAAGFLGFDGGRSVR